MKLDHAGRHGGRNRFEAEEKEGSEAFLAVPHCGKFEVHDVATIGRAPDCRVVINDRSVSRQHARIFYEAGHYWIKDLDSANGTAVNGKKTGFQMLGDKDEISFGGVKAVFNMAGGAAGPSPLGSDPLAGMDPLFPDGTPTGKLRADSPEASRESDASKMDSPGGLSRRQAADKRGEGETFLDKIKGLHRRNRPSGVSPERMGSVETEVSPEVSAAASSDDLKQENERLRKLVAQLERALADSNQRLRNLQQLLDRKDDQTRK